METTTEMPSLASIINCCLCVVVSAVTQFSPLTFGCDQHSFVLVFTDTNSSSGGSTYVYHRVMCEASLRYQRESRSSCRQTLQVEIKQIISQLGSGD